VGVVDIDTNLAYQGAAAAGTGMIVTSDGEVLTNNHVIDGATSITVTVVSTGKSYSAKVVGTDPTADVALVKMNGASGLQTANFGDSSTLKVGDAVTAAGNAGGVGGAPTVASGQVTGLDQQITASDANGGNAEQLTGLIEINAALQPGESGGPLYNAAGQVIGMNTAGSSTGRRRVAGRDNYAIPINTAMSVIKQIETGKSSDTITIGLPGFLGVEVDPNGSAQGTTGASVSDVVSGTPAEQIGLKAGDVITAIDGSTVAATDDLSTLLHTHHAGDKVTITWTDTSGKSHSSSVTLAEGPAN
jgi:S1-C subfamily serine protease